MSYSIKSPLPDDVDAIVKIENSCFTEPWDYDTFFVLCARRGSIQLKEGHTIILKVIELSDSGLAGYVVWEQNLGTKSGRVMNIAIRERDRRKGLGEALILHVFSELKRLGVLECTLEARESNLPARSLYEKVGMRLSGRQVAYYEDKEDAVVFTIKLFP